MSDIAIRVDNLGKRYRIGAEGSGGMYRYKALRDVLAEAVRAPFRRLRRGPRPDNTIWALKDVSFEVQRGEVLGIIGRNGAGKSTLLKILSRITEPTEGYAEIHGRVGSLLEVGTGFHPELTGRENIYLNGAILGMTRADIERKFDEIVAFAEIEKFLDTPVKHYSSGMYVRLAFAVAAHLEPEILLVDEVLAVGDVGFQKKCLGKMQEVAGTGRTVLFISHNMGAIADLCSECVMLEHGRIVHRAASNEVVSFYLSSASKKQGYVNLDNWQEERVGDGPMRLRYMAVRNSRGETTSCLELGEPVEVVIGVSSDKPTSCIVGVAIRNSFGQRIIHLNNTDDESEVVVPSGESEIVVEMLDNVLNAGVYYLSAWIGNTLSVCNDCAMNCLEFKVDNSSQKPVRSLGFVVVPAQWKVQQDLRL